ARLADARGDDLLVEAVLQRYHAATVGDKRRQSVDRTRRVVRLHAQEAHFKTAFYVARQAGVDRYAEFLDGPGDLQPALPHRRDMLGAAVDEQHWQAGAREIRTDGAADGAGAPDQDCVVGYSHLVSMRARVSSTATFHKANMSSSDFS